MKRILMFPVVLMILALLCTGCGHQATNAMAAGTDADQSLPFQQNQKAAQQSPAAEEVTVPAGSMVEVSMQETLSSASARAGDRFDAVLDEPLVVDGKTVAPRGAEVIGRVVAARSSGRLHNPGYLRLTLASIKIDGSNVRLETSSLFFEASSHKKRNWAMIGGGAGGGALIGALAGGPKGALIGSSIGAAAGTGVAYGTGKKEVSVGAERRLAFRLMQPLTANLKS
jgi:hypothetical protein